MIDAENEISPSDIIHLFSLTNGLSLKNLIPCGTVSLKVLNSGLIQSVYDTEILSEFSQMKSRKVSDKFTSSNNSNRL